MKLSGGAFAFNYEALAGPCDTFWNQVNASKRPTLSQRLDDFCKSFGGELMPRGPDYVFAGKECRSTLTPIKAAYDRACETNLLLKVFASTAMPAVVARSRSR
jgi:hypothetical protein